MPGIEHANAVGTNQCCLVFCTGVEDFLLQNSTGFRLLAKARRDDDESTDTLLCSQLLYGGGTEFCGDDHDG